MDSIVIEVAFDRAAIGDIASALNKWLKERKYHFLLHTLRMKKLGVNKTDKKVIVEYEMEKHANDFLDTASNKILAADTNAGWFK